MAPSLTIMSVRSIVFIYYHCCINSIMWLSHHLFDHFIITILYSFWLLKAVLKWIVLYKFFVQVFWWTYVYILLGLDLEVEVLGHRVSVCSALVSGCVNLYSLQQSKGVAPLTFQLLVLSIFSWAILVSMPWYCTMISVCFDLVTNKVEHLLIRLFVIWLSFSVKHLFRSFPQFPVRISDGCIDF